MKRKSTYGRGCDGRVQAPYMCSNCGIERSRTEVKEFITQLHSTLSGGVTIDCVKKNAAELEAFISTNKAKLYPNH